MKLKNIVSASLLSALTFSVQADTKFDELISNTATLNYSVSGQDQVAVPAEVSFRVDRKIIFNVTTPTPAALAKDTVGNDQVITYTLSNLSNAPIGMTFSLEDLNKDQQAYGSLATDTIDGVAGEDDVEYKIFLDVNGNGSYEPATDITEITTSYRQLFSQPGDATDSNPDSVQVHVVITPKQGKENDVFVHELSVTAVETDGSSFNNEAGDPWQPDTTQTVLADNMPTVAERGAVSVASANLAVTKAVAIISNPAGFSGPAKAIPGAIIEYTITVTNSGSVAATDVDITDPVPGQFDLSDSYVETFSITDGSGTVTAPVAGSGPTDVNVSGNTLTFPPLTVPAATGPTTPGSVSVSFTVQLP